MAREASNKERVWVGAEKKNQWLERNGETEKYAHVGKMFCGRKERVSLELLLLLYYFGLHLPVLLAITYSNMDSHLYTLVSNAVKSQLSLRLITGIIRVFPIRGTWCPPEGSRYLPNCVANRPSLSFESAQLLVKSEATSCTCPSIQ